MMKIKLESTETVLTEYEEREIERLIKELQVAQGIFGDSAMRCVYLLRAEKNLQRIISNMLDSFL